MSAAVDLRHQLHARILAPHVERAHALRSIKLVRGNRRDVDVVLNHVERHLADSLHRIAVKQHAALVAQRADLANGLQHANLVVRRHDRDENRLVVHRALQVVEIDAAVLLHRQIGHAEAMLLQPLAAVEHRLVLGRLGDDVVALLAIHLGDALDGEVVALGGAGGEDDFLRTSRRSAWRSASRACSTACSATQPNS